MTPTIAIKSLLASSWRAILKPTSSPLIFRWLLSGMMMISCQGALASISIEPFMECKLIKEDQKRLSCYDELTAAHVDQHSIVDTPKDLQASKDRQAALGSKYLKRNAPEQSGLVTSYKLLSAKKDKKNRWVFTFENGQVWRQTESQYFSKTVTYPISTTLKQGVFGSFDLKIKGKETSYKVKRLR